MSVLAIADGWSIVDAGGAVVLAITGDVPRAQADAVLAAYGDGYQVVPGAAKPGEFVWAGSWIPTAGGGGGVPEPALPDESWRGHYLALLDAAMAQATAGDTVTVPEGVFGIAPAEAMLAVAIAAGTPGLAKEVPDAQGAVVTLTQAQAEGLVAAMGARLSAMAAAYRAARTAITAATDGDQARAAYTTALLVLTP